MSVGLKQFLLPFLTLVLQNAPFVHSPKVLSWRFLLFDVEGIGAVRTHTLACVRAWLQWYGGPDSLSGLQEEVGKPGGMALLWAEVWTDGGEVWV